MEAKKDMKIEDKKSNLSLENRKKLYISGVIEVISFNETQIVLTTCLGMLTIKGEGLKMNKLDVQNGEVNIVGTLNSFVYSGAKDKQDKEGIFERLFK